MSAARLFRWITVFLLVRFVWGGASAEELQLGPLEKPRPRELLVPQGEEPFDIYEALNGSFSSAEQCAKVPNGLWIEVDGRGDCIRYYASGLDGGGGNPKVLVYFGGDAMLRTSKGVRFIGETYERQSPAGIQSDMAQWSRQGGVPAIHIARPGLYGSSGDHNMRRLPREIALMNAALDAVKKRYEISDFILAGQSGGGHIVASLLTRRKDISAAVIASGLVSVKQVVSYWDQRRKVPDWMIYDTRDFVDPIDGIDLIDKDRPPQIYVISDPEDRVVPFVSQLRYVRRLRAAGFDPRHVYAHATDKNRHGLALYARLAAALIARDEQPKEIFRALDDLDLEHIQ